MSLPGSLRRDLRARLARAQRDWRAPGLSAGVVRGGDLVWSAHVGSAELGENAPRRTTTPPL